MAQQIRDFFTTVTKACAITFRRWPYALLASCVVLLLLFAVAWLRNLSFLWYFFATPGFTWTTRFTILASSFQTLQLNSTPLGLTLIVVVALLAAVNISLLVFYIRRRMYLEKEMGTSALGTLFGLLGVGCASCGSVILSSFFGFGATIHILGFLPLHGQEFSYLGIVLLLISIIMVSKKIMGPAVCVRATT